MAAYDLTADGLKAYGFEVLPPAAKNVCPPISLLSMWLNVSWASSVKPWNQGPSPHSGTCAFAKWFTNMPKVERNWSNYIIVYQL